MGSERYVLGYRSEEAERLERQAAFLGGISEDFLRRALRPGMRVLDVGCGPGDVSLVAARIVGPGGSVVGVDRSEESLSRARDRAAAAGLGNVSFRRGEAPFPEVEGGFDALIGRFVLMYFPDPGGALRALLAHVAPGGVVAFQEMILSVARAYPAVPVFDESVSRLVAVYGRLGLDADTGASLARAYRAAGLAPEMSAASRMDGDGKGFCPSWLARTVASALPLMESTGVASAAEVDLPTLEARLRADVEAAGAAILAPLVVGAVATVPA